MTYARARRNVIEDLCLTRTAFRFYPNLHAVSLSFKGLTHPEEQYAQLVFSELSWLQSLHHLTVDVTGPSSLLRQLCEILSDLRLLEKLVIAY